MIRVHHSTTNWTKGSQDSESWELLFKGLLYRPNKWFSFLPGALIPNSPITPYSFSSLGSVAEITS